MVDLIVDEGIESFKKRPHHPTLVTRDYFTISNCNASRVVFSLNKIYIISYFVPKDNGYFFIMASGILNNLNNEQKAIEQILSTFTLIE